MALANSVFLKAKHKGLLPVGGDSPVRVNCNVGANTAVQMAYEHERLASIRENGLLPDCFMDLSIGEYLLPLYKEILRNFDCPVGTVPAYSFPAGSQVTGMRALDILKRQADDGVSFFTLHLTASEKLFKRALKTRKIPVTSRGGSIVLQQMLDTGEENIWLTFLPKIVDLAKAYGIVISLGTTFRPAGIAEACDEVHIAETQEQLKMYRLLQAKGVQVMVENVGHIPLDKLEKHCELLRQFNAPIMPLGPLPTDCAEDEDHIASAIGASMMGYWNCAHIINCITRSEHTKSFFSIEETLEAIRTAKLTAHIIDVARGINLEQDYAMFEKHALMENCLDGDNGQCDRCAHYCPLKFGKDYGTKD